MTQDSSWTSRSANNQNYSGTWSNGGWSSFMNNNNIGGQDSGSTPSRTYSWTITFSTFGQQVFDTAVDDTGSVYINGVYQFDMGGYGGQTSKATPGYISPGTYTISATSNNTGSGPWGIALDWTGVIPPPLAAITFFDAEPNPQNSTSGTRQYSTKLSWTSTNAVSATITSSSGETYSNLSVNGTLDITNLPQSNASSNSPAERSYTLTLTNLAGATTSKTITVKVTNDNFPSNSWTTSFTGLEPNTEYQLQLGTLSGVDMNTIASSTTNSVFFGVPNGAFANPQIFTNNKVVALKCTTLPFNTDVTGETGQFGKVNTRTIPVVIGSNSFNVTVSTKKPVIREDFNYSDVVGTYPYTDIDLITNSPVEYTVTETISLDDIDVPVEILSDNPDVQIKINNDTWKYVREL